MKPIYTCFDTVIGPSYHYGGLALGNTHSLSHRHQVSYPKKAALQGLFKMKLLLDHGVNQYVLPPYKRDYKSLIQGYYDYQGDFEDNLKRLYDDNLNIFSAFFSASSAWLANAWTMTSSVDSVDGCYHVSPASLQACFHRQLDVDQTIAILTKSLCSKSYVTCHHPAAFFDEGAANMIRLSAGGKGLYLFVSGSSNTKRFQSRHDRRSWQTLVSQHQLDPKYVIYLTQHPDAIDAGVFHNDVISFGLDDLLVVHENAFVDQANHYNTILERYFSCFGTDLTLIQIPDSILTLKDAVNSYFFNSQLVRKHNDCYLLLVPSRCHGLPVVDYFISEVSRQWGKQLDVVYCDVEESIKNGGGPACLRNSIDVYDDPNLIFDDRYLLTLEKYDYLVSVINQCYPHSLELRDFLSVSFLNDFDTINLFL